MHKNAQKVECEKLRAKFSVTTPGYSIVKIARLDDAFLDVFNRKQAQQKFNHCRNQIKDLVLSEANNIYISESLTASNRELFNEALKVKEDLTTSLFGPQMAQCL